MKYANYRTRACIYHQIFRYIHALAVFFNHTSFGLPATPQCLIDIYHGNKFVADGIAHPYLGIEITTLGIEHIHIIDDAVDVLQLCQIHISLGRTFKFGTQLVDLLYLLKSTMAFFASLKAFSTVFS